LIIRPQVQLTLRFLIVSSSQGATLRFYFPQDGTHTGKY
jgi:hypothetical protein